MNNRQRLEYLRNEKKSFKNLRYISVSVRDSSNSLATIIAGHLLKMATGGKKRMPTLMIIAVTFLPIVF